MTKPLVPLYLIVILLVASCREDDVRPEQAKCKKILENLSTYKQKTIDYTGRVEQNGNIVGYLDGKELKMALASSFSERGRREERYFFHDNHLIAVEQQDFTYNAPKYMSAEVAKTTGDSVWYDDAKTVMKLSWFYFYNDHMVKWVDPQKKEVPDNAVRFDAKDSELRSNAEKLKLMLLP